MQVIMHQTHQTIGDFDAIEEYFESHFVAEAKKSPKQFNIHLFPELFLTGYPLQDLLLQRSFIENYLSMLKRLDKLVKSLPTNSMQIALLGGPAYEFSEQENSSISSFPSRITNSIFMAKPGQGLERIYDKKSLPNYDIFDEKKYFIPGTTSGLFQIHDCYIGLTVCEDMWGSLQEQDGPCAILDAEAKQKGVRLHAIFNLSASPYHVGKPQGRLKKARELAGHFQCPVFYVNRVGGEDEILFDGHSFVVSSTGESMYLPQWESARESIPLEELTDLRSHTAPPLSASAGWEDLLRPRLSFDGESVKLKPLGPEECLQIENALVFGLREYASKNGFRSFLVGLSGGLDSAMVLALLAKAFPAESVNAIFLPSKYSAQLSYDICSSLCSKLGIALKTFPIKFLHSTVSNQYEQNFSTPMEGLADENVQSRLRGLLLYARANATNAIVINTSNKSELAVGYSTQYGDSVGAISPLGDLYKTDLFQIASAMNARNEIFGEELLTRAPSAELRDDQKDEQSLPPYPVLDTILEGILSYRMDAHDLKECGMNSKDIEKTFELYSKSEYKRRQFCPIIKVTSKSFGFGYRVPISKKAHYFTKGGML